MNESYTIFQKVIPISEEVKITIPGLNDKTIVSSILKEALKPTLYVLI